jgi:hypothetical protein
VSCGSSTCHVPMMGCLAIMAMAWHRQTCVTTHASQYSFNDPSTEVQEQLAVHAS